MPSHERKYAFPVWKGDSLTIGDIEIATAIKTQESWSCSIYGLDINSFYRTRDGAIRLIESYVDLTDGAIEAYWVDGNEGNMHLYVGDVELAECIGNKYLQIEYDSQESAMSEAESRYGITTKTKKKYIKVKWKNNFLMSGTKILKSINKTGKCLYSTNCDCTGYSVGHGYSFPTLDSAKKVVESLLEIRDEMIEVRWHGDFLIPKNCEQLIGVLTSFHGVEYNSKEVARKMAEEHFGVIEK